MPAVLARHQLQDGTRFSVALHAENDAFIAPLHPLRLPLGSLPCLLPRKFEPDLPIAFRIIAPGLAHLHEQEQMHLLLDDVRDLAACLRPYRPDGLSVPAEHDLALACALYIDRLLDADR